MNLKNKIADALEDYRDTVGLDNHDLHRYRGQYVDDILQAVSQELLSDKALDAMTTDSKARVPLIIPEDMVIGLRMMNRARMEVALIAASITEGTHGSKETN